MVIVGAMSFGKADGPLSVHVPSPREDRPSWWGVAAIAVVGFAVGVAWPRLAGVRLGPSVPDGPGASSSASPAAPIASAGPVARTATAPPAAMPAPASPQTASQAAASSPASSPASSLPPASVAGGGSPHVSVPHGSVFSCKTAGGDTLKGTECGAMPALDRIVQPRLRRLADCPEAAATSGVLHLVVRADFAHDALTVDLGRDRDHDKGVDKAVASATQLLACAKSALGSASLQGVAHDNARYSVAYPVTFGVAPASPAAEIRAPAAAAATPATPATESSAQVEWEVAIVRDAPHTTGKVLARLQRGTPLRIGAPKDGWYPIKYGDGFGSDGWVYRGAIGK
jgi:hypothetical protein